jgi:hypothetical protein
VLAGRVGALDIYRLRDEPRAIILVAYQVRLEGDVQRRRNFIADRAIQTCATILPVRFAQRSARTGTAAARILSSPSTYRDDHDFPERRLRAAKTKNPAESDAVRCGRGSRRSSLTQNPATEGGPEGGVPLNSGVGLGGKGNTQ